MSLAGIARIAVIIVCIITVIALLIVILTKWVKSRNRKKELKRAAEKQMREESLERMILNERNASIERNRANNPYEVSYEKGVASQGRRAAGQIMVSLEEKNELSTKKFVLNPMKPIRIGSGLQGNDVVVQGEGIAEFQCEIFESGGKIYVRNKNAGSPTVLRRKRERALIDDRGLRIQTGDMIIMGKVVYGVTLIGG